MQDVLRIDLAVDLEARRQLASAHVAGRMVVAQPREHGEEARRGPLVLHVGAELRAALRRVVAEELCRDRIAVRVRIVRDRLAPAEVLDRLVDPELDRVVSEHVEVIDPQAFEVRVPVLLQAVDAAGEIVREVAEIADPVVPVPWSDLRVRVAVGGVVREDRVDELIVLDLHVVRIVRKRVDRNLERRVVVREIEGERVVLAEVRDRA